MSDALPERRVGAAEIQARLQRHDEKLQEMAATLQILLDEGRDAASRADERARLLKEADDKRAVEVALVAKELEIRKARMEIRWTPWQQILAAIVVMSGLVGLALELVDVVTRGH